MKVSKTDYKTQKEMLTEYIGQHITYDNVDYILYDFLDIKITDDKENHYIEGILMDSNFNKNNIPVSVIFKIVYPQCCLGWDRLPPFPRK